MTYPDRYHLTPEQSRSKDFFTTTPYRALTYKMRPEPSRFGAFFVGVIWVLRA